MGVRLGCQMLVNLLRKLLVSDALKSTALEDLKASIPQNIPRLTADF